MKKIITKIEVQKRNKERVNIYINDEYSFACSSELVYKFNLTPKEEIEENKLLHLKEEDDYLKGKSYSLKVLEFGYKTEKEIQDKLIEKGYEERTIAKVMEFLLKYDFINDKRYVKLYIKDKIERFGKNKIKYNLVRKGIDKELIENYIYQVPKEREETVSISLATKKYEALVKKNESYAKVSKKLFDFLTRNGYSYDVSKEVIEKVIDKNHFLKNQNDETKEEESLEEMIKIGKKRYNLLLKNEADKNKRLKKLYDFLMRKGYSYDSIKASVSEIMED